MAQNGRGIAGDDGRSPLQVAEEGVLALRRTHQRHSRRRADGQHGAAHAGRQRDQVPLIKVHFGVHAQHREHHRNVVDDGRQHANQDVGGGGAEPVVHGDRGQFEVADIAQSAHREDHAEEEQQRIPLRVADIGEHVEAAMAVAVLVVGAEQEFQAVAVEHQEGHAHHHAHEGREVQELLEADGSDDGQGEQAADDQGALFHLDLLFFGEARRFVGNGEMHDGRGHHEVDHGRDEEMEKIEEFRLARLPDHQSGNVAEGAEGAAGIGRADQVDEAQGNEGRAVGTHRHHHRAYQQGRGQVVGDRRQEESNDAGDPKQLAVIELAADQPGTQGLEDVALGHGVDVGHRHQQEQEQLGVLLEIMLESLVDLLCRDAMGRSQVSDVRPDDARGQDDGLGFPEMGELLGHHERIGDDEDQDAI